MPSPDPSTYLVAHEVSYAYRAAAPAVNAVSGVSLAIPKGSFTGLLGPNGCGKTTLLKLMAGVLRPARARCTLDGRDARRPAAARAARHVAVVPQDTHPAFDYTALEIVLMGRHPHLRPMQLEGPARPRHRARVARRHRHAHLATARSPRSAAAKSSAW